MYVFALSVLVVGCLYGIVTVLILQPFWYILTSISIWKACADSAIVLKSTLDRLYNLNPQVASSSSGPKRDMTNEAMFEFILRGVNPAKRRCAITISALVPIVR